MPVSMSMSNLPRFSAAQPSTQGDYNPAPSPFDLAAKAKPIKGGMGGTVARDSTFGIGSSSVGEAASAATYTAPSEFAAPAKGKSKKPSAAFGGGKDRFSTPVSQGASTSYDVTHGTMGAAVNKKSFNKSGGGTFGSTAKRDTGAWGVKPATPRAGTSDEMFTAPSSFGGATKAKSKGPSSSFGGGKDRFASKKQSSDSASDYTPAGMGSVKKTSAKSSAMGGGASRFAPAKAAVDADYSGAMTSDFSSKGSAHKSFNRSTNKNLGFGGAVPRVSAVEEAAKAAASNAPAYYDTSSSTGAFSAVAKKGSKPSAAFASKSKKVTEVRKSDAPDPGIYNVYGAGDMGLASKSFNKSIASGAGGFGTSAARDTGFFNATAGAETPGPGSYTGSSAFNTPGDALPSAAFASASGAGSRLATIDVTDAPSGPSYDPHSSDGMASTAAKTFNKGGGTMGKSGRFEPTREAAPGDYMVQPSEFSMSKSASALSNVGFGGTAARESLFGEVAVSETPDTYYMGPGAFDSKPSGPSAAFASKSGKAADVALREVGDPGAYNPYDSSSMAAQTSKSFNRSAQRGAGGFGTNAKRTELTVPSDAPGPGAYENTDGAMLFERDAFKPSAAFASASEARPELRSSEAPDANYDVERADGLGMAASAARTFNSKSGTGGFGAQLPRQLHEVKHTPGPGEYESTNVNAPTVSSNLGATRGKTSGAFASDVLRTSDDWATMFNR